ncbi:hypothetical protein QP028_13820 [Corynebacterium suedekumii]|nr:hypothetical protein QP028_13820 [Corynebacterium suedekumii]
MDRDQGLRTLVKKCHPGALELLGAAHDPAIMVRDVAVTPDRLRIGETLAVTVTVANESGTERDVIVDYQIHFRRPDGSLRPATFKAGRVPVAPGATAEVRARRPLGQLTTRTLHPGEHLVTAQANGNPGGRATLPVTTRCPRVVKRGPAPAVDNQGCPQPQSWPARPALSSRRAPVHP